MMKHDVTPNVWTKPYPSFIHIHSIRLARGQLDFGWNSLQTMLRVVCCQFQLFSQKKLDLNLNESKCFRRSTIISIQVFEPFALQPGGLYWCFQCGEVVLVVTRLCRSQKIGAMPVSWGFSNPFTSVERTRENTDIARLIMIDLPQKGLRQNCQIWSNPMCFLEC